MMGYWHIWINGQEFALNIRTLGDIAEFIAKAMAAQEISFNLLSQVVSHNCIAFEYILAKQGDDVCVTICVLE